MNSITKVSNDDTDKNLNIIVTADEIKINNNLKRRVRIITLRTGIVV